MKKKLARKAKPASKTGERQKKHAARIRAEVKAIRQELAEIAPSGRNRLSHADALPLLQRLHLGTLASGLIQSLAVFAVSVRNLAGIAARTMHDALLAGKTPEEALRKMEPGLPAKTEELLVLGARNGILDHVLADVLDVCAGHEAEAARDEALKVLLVQYKSRKPSAQACVGCVARELDKIWRRAATEGARAVIIEQDGERFMHQTYAAVKPVRVTEPGGAYVFNALKATLAGAAARARPLEVGVGKLVCRGENGRFALSSGNRRLEVSFR